MTKKSIESKETKAPKQPAADPLAAQVKANTEVLEGILGILSNRTYVMAGPSAVKDELAALLAKLRPSDASPA